MTRIGINSKWLYGILFQPHTPSVVREGKGINRKETAIPTHYCSQRTKNHVLHQHINNI